MIFEKKKILGVDFTNIETDDFLKYFKNGFVMPCNVDMLMKMQQDKDFFKLSEKADFVLCDSQIIFFASKFLKLHIKEKITGSDIFPKFCKYHQNNSEIKIFLLGSSKQEIVDKAMYNINHKIGRKIIIDTYSPSFGFEDKDAENKKIIDMINNSTATVLAIGVGAPKQEKWIDKHKEYLKNVNIFFAIGATIDFEANFIDRAPKWMSRNGLEWLYRLIKEPKRLYKRYLIEDIPFFYLIIKQKLGIYKHKWEK